MSPEPLQNGYNVYRAVGKPWNFDPTEPIAQLPPGQTTLQISGASALPNARYFYVVRPVRNGVESSDLSCAAEFCTDADGNWRGAIPAPPCDVRAEPAPGGALRVCWTAPPQDERPQIAAFAIYCSPTPQIDVNNPQHVVTRNGAGEQEHILHPPPRRRRWIAIASQTAEAVRSQLIRCDRPFAADACVPHQPQLFTRTESDS